MTSVVQVVQGRQTQVTTLGNAYVTGYLAPFATRTAFVAWAATVSPAVGLVVHAGGYAYRYIGSGTVIADAPGWIYDGPSWYASARTTSVDSATSLTSIFADNNTPPVTIAVGPYDDNTLGSSWACARIGSSVVIPASKHLDGLGTLTQFRPLAALGANPMFRMNVNADGTPVVTLPLGISSKVSGVWVVNRDEAGNIMSNLGPIFQFHGQNSFEDIFVLNPRTIIEQATGGNAYCDMTTIRRLRAGSQYADGSYLVNLRSNGDAFVIDGLTNDTPYDPTGANRKMRGYSIRAISRTGGRISAIVNGDIRMSYCSSIEVKDLHMEHGYVLLESTSGELGNAMFYMRGDQTGGVDDPVVVVPLQIVSADSSRDTKRGGALGVHDVQFLYLYGWGSPLIPFGTQGNFQIDSPQLVTIDRLYRVAQTVDATFNAVMGSIQTLTTTQTSQSELCARDFNAYSHFASVHCQWEYGDAYGSQPRGRWLISTSQPSLLSLPAGGISALASVAVSPSGANTTWQLSSATYYYKLVAYQDIQRAVGIAGTEASLALTAAGNIAQATLDPVIRGRQVMLRLYRGTSSGSYSSYVDIPWVGSGGALLDNGADCNGFVWISRTPGAVDAVNDIGVTKAYMLRPSEFTTGSDAYGNAEITTSVNTLPTVGAWRIGDKVMFRDGMGENGLVKLGWLRCTNCTAAATANTLYTDWMPIMASSPHGTRTSSQLNDKTNTVNTKYKSAGLRVFNATTLKWVTAQGASSTATWIEDGTATVYTPV